MISEAADRWRVKCPCNKTERKMLPVFEHESQLMSTHCLSAVATSPVPAGRPHRPSLNFWQSGRNINFSLFAHSFINSLSLLSPFPSKKNKFYSVTFTTDWLPGNSAIVDLGRVVLFWALLRTDWATQIFWGCGTVHWIGHLSKYTFSFANKDAEKEAGRTARQLSITF